MTAPKRLLEGASPLEARLLRSWKTGGPSPSARRATLAAGAAIAAAATSTKVAAAATAGIESIAPKAIAAGSAGIVKWLAAGSLVLLTGAVMVAIVASGASRETTATVPTVSATPSTTTLRTPPPTASSNAETTLIPAPSTEEQPKASPPRAARANVPRGRPSAPPPSSSLGEQVGKLEHARAALQAGETEASLIALDRYEEEFPNGLLRQEAALLRIEALVRKGDRSAADRAAKSFFAAYPSSPHEEKIRRLLDNR
jgi:hypothetical protein